MQHPRWIYSWRDYWNPPSVFHENQAKKTFEHDRNAMAQKLASIEADRQRDMPALWVSYAQVAAAIVMPITGAIFLWRWLT